MKRSLSPCALARVLLVDDELASRLTLQTLLEAGGYAVDVAASAAEAFAKLDEGAYALVLSDLHMEHSESGIQVLSYARQKSYRPATALVAAFPDSPLEYGSSRMSIQTEDVPVLLDKVAKLIGARAVRRSTRSLLRPVPA